MKCQGLALYNILLADLCTKILITMKVMKKRFENRNAPSCAFHKLILVSIPTITRYGYVCKTNQNAVYRCAIFILASVFQQSLP